MVNSQNSFNGAVAVWNMARPMGNEEFPFDLEVFGKASFERLEGEDFKSSVLRGGDGHAVTLDDACLRMSPQRAYCLRPENDAFTLYIRAFREKGNNGCLFFSDFVSLNLYNSGLAAAYLGTEVSTGCVYREMPLCLLEDAGWLDLILELSGGVLSLYCNGGLRARMSVPQHIRAPFDDEMIIGGFKCSKPDTYGIADTFCRFRSVKIDTVALWHCGLPDERLAALSGCTELRNEIGKDISTEACLWQSAFFDAAAAKDLKGCKRAWDELCRLAAIDPRRPAYHLTQPFGTIFDPCGAFFHKGHYHVFSYHNIDHLLNYSSLDHYMSEDLVHWTGLPIAPLADSPSDVYCIYLMNHFYDTDGSIRALYTGQGIHGKRGILARCDDGLITYTDKKEVLKKYQHDGHVFRHDGRWYTITSKLCRGNRAGDLGDAVMLWSSDDLESWTEEGEVFTQRKEPENPDGFMEFPYLLSFGDKDVMILGGHPVKYWVGRFSWKTKKFTPDSEKGILLDLTNHFHCDNPLCVDNKGEGGSERRLIMALYTDVYGDIHDFLPFSCVHVQPRVLTLEDGHLMQQPLPELETLRGDCTEKNGLALKPSGETQAFPAWNTMELSAEFSPAAHGIFGVRLYDGDTNAELVCVRFDAENRDFRVDGAVKLSGGGASFLGAEQPVKIRLFLDKQLTEVFVNGQTCTTSLTALPVSVSVSVFSENAEVSCDLKIWKVNPSFGV